MSITNRIQCYAYEGFDIYRAINLGKITFSVDRHLVVLDYDVDTMGISAMVEATTDPSGVLAHGILYYNTENGKIYFCDGDEYHYIALSLGREGINVIRRNIKGPLDSASEGDQFLVSGSPNAAWRSHKNSIALYTGNSWEFIVPEVGQVVGVEEEFIDYIFNGYAWERNIETKWVEAIPPEGYDLEDDGQSIPVIFGSEPGVVSSSTSGVPGVAIMVARSDHGHDLGPHPHTDNTNGGTIAHSALTGIGQNDHHNRVHSGLDHTGTIGTWAQIDLTNSSLANIANRSHTLLTDIGLNTHSQIDSYMQAHNHDGVNSVEIPKIDAGSF